jgi:hypothetical protein
MNCIDPWLSMCVIGWKHVCHRSDAHFLTLCAFPANCKAQVPQECIPAGSSAGWLAVADSRNRRVQVVTLTGQVIRMLAGDAANGCQLSIELRGIAVCVNAYGNSELLVADTWNHRVVAFRLDGRAARVVCGTGNWGSGEGELNWPVGLAVTATGDLWVGEFSNDRVSLFRQCM